MALHFSVNQIKALATGPFFGRYLFQLKEVAVLAGWTVKGSSDGSTRYAYNGVTAALPVPQQGSGGAYDCWLTGDCADHGSKVDGDPRHDSWIVLENDGRELLMRPTISTNNFYDGVCTILYARKGSGGFDGALVNATTPPAAPAVGTDEQAIFGTRGDWQFNHNIFADEGYFHCWSSDVPVNGVLPLGFNIRANSGASFGMFCVASLHPNTIDSTDPDPAAVFRKTGGLSAAIDMGYAWNPVTGAFEQFHLGALNGAFWVGGGIQNNEAKDAFDDIPIVVGAGASEVMKGKADAKTCFSWCGTNRNHPNTGTDGDGADYVYCGSAGGFLHPWPLAATIPLP